jgi:hypothetical protein
MRSEPILPPVFTAQQAVKAGLSVRQIEGRVRTGHWRRLRRAAFCQTTRWERSSPEQRHLLLAQAFLLTRITSTPFVFSHTSAAALSGLPVPRRLLDTVCVTVDPRYRLPPRREADLVRQAARLPPEHVTTTHGLPVTSPARTVADCLRHLDAVDGVPIADAAVRAGLCSLEQIAQVLAVQVTWPYAALAATALPLVDPRRESALESRSAVVMHRHDIPPPVPQVKILDRRGVLVGRVDFAWLELCVVGEADGRGKYTDGDAIAAFDAEKERQARLEALGLVVVRWGASHLVGDPPPLVERLRRALESGGRSTFIGRAA